MSTRVAAPKLRKAGRHHRVGYAGDVEALHRYAEAGGWECHVADHRTAERIRQWALREGRKIGRLYHTRWRRADGILRVETWRRASVAAVDGPEAADREAAGASIVLGVSTSGAVNIDEGWAS